MTEPMQRCDNCLKEYPQSKMATHFGYCRRNIKKCQKCGEMYDINSVQQHQQEFHKKIPCQYCKIQFGSAQVEKHKSTCSKRTQFCQYCQLNVPINQYKKHLQACQSRTKPCDKCMKSITNKDYLIHLATCKGITKEVKDFDQFIRKPNRQQYFREQKKQQIYQRRPIDFKRKQVVPNPPAQQNTRSKEKINIAPKNQSQPSNNTRNSGSISNNVPNYSKPANNINNINGLPAQPKKQAFDKNYQNFMAPKPPSRGREQPKKSQSNSQTYGVKRPIQNKTKDQIRPYYQKKQQIKPSISNRNAIKRQQPARNQKPKFDPKDYGGYEAEIPQQFLFNPRNNRDQDQQDAEIQKIIMKSLQQQNKQHNISNLPKELQSEDLMNTSFYRDIIDIEKQKALYEQAERQAKKNKGKSSRR